MITTIVSLVEARWSFLGYTTPLLYGHEKVSQLRDIDSVAAGNGRVIWHWGTYSAPESSAGSFSAKHSHQFNTGGRACGSTTDIFTFHCHGYDPAFPSRSDNGASQAYETVCWLLSERIVGVLRHVATANSLSFEFGNKTLIRDPVQIRLGDLVRFEINVISGLRKDPRYDKVTRDVVPSGAVSLT